MPPRGLRLCRTRPLSSTARNVSFQRRTIYGYTQSKALVFTEHGDPAQVLRLHSHSISPAHSSLVTARFLAAPINPADINAIQGVYPTKPPFTTALSTSTPSAVPGNEGLAEVLSAGSSAKDPSTNRPFQKGDWLLMRAPAGGTWRTHIQAPSETFTLLSAADREAITPLQAATVSVNPCTAYAMLKGFVGAGDLPTGTPPLKEGEWFAQNGANSGVGRAAIQLGRAWGLKSVNFIRDRPDGPAATQALKDELIALGADIVYTDSEAAEKGFAKRVKADLPEGEEVKLALNCVGGKSALSLSKILAPGGWHVTYGAMAKQPVSIGAGMLIFGAQRYAGFWVSEWSARRPDAKAAAVSEVLKLTREGKFKDVPVQEVKWDWDTKEEQLVGAVQGALEGYRGGKGVFVFGEMPG